MYGGIFLEEVRINQTRFAQGLCFKKLFFVFLIGSIIGAYYEQIYNLITTYLSTHEIVWSLRRGVVYGPFNVIYGFGAACMSYVLLKKDYKWYQIIARAGILGGMIEYILSFLQEVFIHTTSWDYSGKFLNINGRTTLPFMLVWGLLGLLFVKVVYPFVSSLIEKIPVHIGNICFKILLVFMIINMFLSWTALIRQALRKNHYPAYTFLGRFYDTYYTDEFLSKYFPNMAHLDKE